MTRRNLLACAPALAGGRIASARPNIEIFLADDLGWNDVGYHGSDIRTPNIDRLSQQGVRFTHLYSYPFCSPARAGIMTGRSPARYGMIYSVIRPWSPYGIPQDEHLMPQTFKALGYQTAMAGKWHLGHAHRRMLPHHRGFDHFYGFVNADIDYYQHTHASGLDWQRNGKGVREEGYSTDLLAAEACRLIENRDRSRPLFLYTAFGAVHTPLQAPRHLIDGYSHLSNPRRRIHAAMAEAMDGAIGRILGALDSAGIAKDTLVLFLSDNGGPGYAGGANLPLRGAKGTVFEGGIRVPAVMRWPGVLPPGGRVAQLASVLDLLPTLAAAAGGKPAGTKDLDGRNIWPQITGAPALPREPMFFAVKRNETPDYQFAVRKGEWKLVREDLGSKGETHRWLFNLDEDPEEKTDLAAESPALVRSLEEEIDKWRGLHPRAEINSSMTPHPGWIPPADYAQAAAEYEW